VLKCDHLTLAVPGRVLARDVGFEAKRGEIWAVLGANGSGKTTLVHTLAGLAPVQAGAVALDGAPVGGRTNREQASLVGILLQQEDAEFWGNVLEYVLLGRFPRTHTWFGWARSVTPNWRSSTLGATGSPARACVVRTNRRGRRPTRPSSRISRAMRFLPTRVPPVTSSRCTRGAP